MQCYICEKNIFLCLGVRIMDHVYSRGTSMKKGWKPLLYDTERLIRESVNNQYGFHSWLTKHF